MTKFANHYHGIVALSLLLLFVAFEPTIERFIYALLSSSSALNLAPVSDTPSRRPFYLSLVMLLLTLGGRLASIDARVMLLLLILLIQAEILLDCRARFRHVRPLFSHLAVWTGLEAFARLFYVNLLCMLSLFYVLCAEALLPMSCALVLSILYYAAIVARILTGRTLLIGPKKERMIKEYVTCDVRTLPSVDSEVSDDIERMRDLYARIVRYVEENKPYLTPDFSREDMEIAVYTNKTYISQSINVIAGRNFRSFLNKYRVEEVKKLLEKNPHMKDAELARNSGFHSGRTMKDVFLKMEGKTPREYAVMISLGRPKDPSNLKGGGQ